MPPLARWAAAATRPPGSRRSSRCSAQGRPSETATAATRSTRSGSAARPCRVGCWAWAGGAGQVGGGTDRLALWHACCWCVHLDECVNQLPCAAGLAQALVEEDAPDAEGFRCGAACRGTAAPAPPALPRLARSPCDAISPPTCLPPPCPRPSTAFCRALDAEEEYNEVDEMATGLIARRQGREALPPRDTQVGWGRSGWGRRARALACRGTGRGPARHRCHTTGWHSPPPRTALPDTALASAAALVGPPQVLEDNFYEQRAAAAAAATAAADAEQPASMEVEEPAGAAAAAPATAAGEPPVLRRSSLSGRTSSGSEEGKEKKKVRFEGIAAPYVPPSRRPGYVPRWAGGVPGCHVGWLG